MGGVPMEQPGAFVMWVSQYGQIVFFFAQLVYWLVIAAAVTFAAYQAKRFVDHACAAGRAQERGSRKRGDVEGTSARSETVDVERFVE